MRFDADGNIKKKTEFDSDYLVALREGGALNEDGSKMKIERDGDVSDDSEAHEAHLTEIKKRLAKNLPSDALMAKERIKEKRQKIKKRLRAEMGLDKQSGDEEEDGGMVLATPSDNDENESQSQGSDRYVRDDDDDEEESIEELPLKKRQKTSAG